MKSKFKIYKNKSHINELLPTLPPLQLDEVIIEKSIEKITYKRIPKQTIMKEASN